MTLRFALISLLALTAPALSRADSVTIDFSDLSLDPESYYNGADGASGFTSNGADFRNSYNPTSGSWSGWSYSNTTDTTTPGFLNQFSSYAGGDASGDGIYGVAFGQSPSSVRFDLPELGPGQYATGMSARFTNTTYAALSMLLGDTFSKQFGGPTGNDPDYFLLTILGFSDLGAAGSVVGAVDFYLADFRFADNSQDYIVDEWTLVDLSSLIGARSIGFRLTSSDVGDFGMNTPAYFAMDDFVIQVVPEPSSLAMLALGSGVVGLFVRRRLRRSR